MINKIKKNESLFTKKEKRFFKILGCVMIFSFIMSVIIFQRMVLTIPSLLRIRLYNYHRHLPDLIILGILYYFLKKIEQKTNQNRFDLTQFEEKQFRRLLDFFKVIIGILFIISVMGIITSFFFWNLRKPYRYVAWIIIWSFGGVYDILNFVVHLMTLGLLYNLALDFTKEKRNHWIGSEKAFKIMLVGLMLIILDFTYFGRYRMVHSRLFTYIIQTLVEIPILSVIGLILISIGFGINYMEG